MDTERDLMALARKAKQQDDRALQELLRQIRPGVLRYLRHRVRSQPASRWLAEEMTQDVLLKVATHIGQVRATTESQFIAWVRTVGRNTVRDWHRRREAELERRIAESDRGAGERWLRVAYAWGEIDAPDIDRVDELIGRLLMEAQGELSSGTQEVVRRKLLLCETWQETGEAVGTTGPGAKRRWQRAVDRMRREVLERATELPEDLRNRVFDRLGMIGRFKGDEL